MKIKSLVSTKKLLMHLGDPNWVIIDCRFDLAKPEWGFEDYQKAHIPGAFYAHLDRDLSGTPDSKTGRHPLPESSAFLQRLSEWGVTPEKQVVAYDTTGGSFAARLWWLLRYYHHQKVAVLDGGFSAWTNENRPLATGIEQNTTPTHSYPIEITQEMVVTTQQVETLYKNPNHLFIDARASERYRGEVEPIDRVAGHIPGAKSRFHGDNLLPNGKFKPVSQLKKEFHQLIDNTPMQNVVVYCGSGVTSCHHLLALDLCGLTGAKLYAGSWSEWIQDSNHPIAVGEN